MEWPMDDRQRRLLTIGHSYCVALNRRLAHEMARISNGTWLVTVVAPSFFHGDLRSFAAEACSGEHSRLRCVAVRFTKRIHVMLYGTGLRSIMKEGWDFIHCWEEPFIVAGGQVAYWAPTGTPLVFTTYQNLDKRYPPPFSAIERYCVRRAAGWIAGGSLVEEVLLRRKGYPNKPHAVIPLGVDTDHFCRCPDVGADVRRALGWLESEPPVIGFVGRFVEQKGIPLLVRVLDNLRRPWRALFVGNGPLEAELRRWANERPERVRIVEGVKHGDVWRFLNAMDLLCVPSRTTPAAREQFGRVIVEGFSCGVPVLGSDSGEIPRVIGGAGVVIQESDEIGWGDQINRLLSNPQERARMAVAGRQRAMVNYAWPVIAQRHLQFFESLLRHCSPGIPRLGYGI
jgi:glycosyltransferase involved in cell wall biosynthesis